MRRLPILLVCLIMAFPLFAGGNQDSKGSGISDDERNAVSADGIAWKKYSGTTLHLGMNKHIYTTTIRSVINEFEQKTGIRIIIDEYAQDEFMTKRLVDLSSGAGTFDIVMMDSICTQAALAGWIENLEPWFNRRDLVDKAAYNVNDISPSFKQAFTVNGSLYAIPVSGEKQILFYRKDVFQQKGLKVPATFDELYETAKLLKQEYPAGILLRGQKIHTVSNCTGVIWSYGGKIADDPTQYNRAVFNSPEGIRGADMYTTLAREFGPPGIGNYTWYECVSDFQQGKAAMYLDMSVFMSQFEDPSSSQVAGKVGYAPMPAGPAGSKPTGGAWAVSMSTASKHKDAAFLFLSWITGPEVSKQLALEGGIAARGSFLNDPELVNKYPADWLAAYQHGLAAEVPETTFPIISKNEEYLDTIGTAFNSLILRKRDVKPVLDDAAAKVTILFQESKQ
ncbi:ABC transporter substrate-binding protein [Breznakiella homolactica]|uniref:Sugar ABC transporter substrate-binding protein n=1 Tax=Breznakiella homolactica TaxID=2798577 RepID=A0A7T8BB45_9SPIR|nr:sugar ABC transporter substrate-binding protein [Breznakiella homolactica]QQO10172.1 sugar ABC transporter substrate-binding protein [Breznakiella homolactica]